jgi:hypothetical protein
MANRFRRFHFALTVSTLKEKDQHGVEDGAELRSLIDHYTELRRPLEARGAVQTKRQPARACHKESWRFRVHQATQCHLTLSTREALVVALNDGASLGCLGLHEGGIEQERVGDCDKTHTRPSSHNPAPGYESHTIRHAQTHLRIVK